MDGGKRRAGADAADVAARFPGSVTVRDYAEFVALYLNGERVRAVMVTDLILALRVATNDEKYPRSWGKLLDGEDS